MGSCRHFDLMKMDEEVKDGRDESQGQAQPTTGAKGPGLIMDHFQEKIGNGSTC
jgi:hypothetical protein